MNNQLLVNKIIIMFSNFSNRDIMFSEPIHIHAYPKIHLPSLFALSYEVKVFVEMSNYWNEIEVQKVPIKSDKDWADIIT